MNHRSTEDIVDRLKDARFEAVQKAWDSLARYKFYVTEEAA